MLAIFAGQGALPTYLVEHCETPTMVIALDQFLPDDLVPDLKFRLETLGSAIETLVDKGVDRLCLSGRISRPAIDSNAIDAATRPLVPILMKAMGQGDDGALRAVIDIFENAGISIVGAHEIAPDLLPPARILGRVSPDEMGEKNATRAAEIVTAMGAADVGQSCVVGRGQALAIEGLGGTDWMLNSLLHTPDAPDSSGAILYKAPKPSQDLRVDMPVIGPETLYNAARVGLSGVVIARNVMVLDRDACIKIADQRGLFLWVR